MHLLKRVEHVAAVGSDGMTLRVMLVKLALLSEMRMLRGGTIRQVRRRLVADSVSLQLQANDHHQPSALCLLVISEMYASSRSI